MDTLAILGGSPVRTAPFPAWPISDAHDLEALQAADPFGKNGSACRHLAARFAAFNEVPYCVPVANGTVSLEMILRALGIGFGDEVILPAYTFIATLSSIVYTGATPIFADIEGGTYNLSVREAESKITVKTKAVVAVAIGGQPFDVQGFEDMTKRHGIHLIVDAAQAVGAIVNGCSIGSYGIAASFSCQNTKNLTAGEGGFITTKDKELYEKLLTLEGNEMHEQQAALLNSQMDALEEQMAIRSQNAEYLNHLLESNPLFFPMDLPAYITRHAYHLYRLRVNSYAIKTYDLTKEDIIRAIQKEGLNIAGGYVPLYANPSIAQEAVNKRIEKPIDLTPLPVTDYAAYAEGLWFEQQVLLGTRKDMEDIAAILQKVSDQLVPLANQKAKGFPVAAASSAPTTEPAEPATLESVLASGIWGTFGPVEKKTAHDLAVQSGYAYSVLTHSFTSALQTVLRALEIGYQDPVFVREGEDPILSRAESAVLEIGQTLTNDTAATKIHLFLAPSPSGAVGTVKIHVDHAFYAAVSDYGIAAAIFTEDPGIYERAFGYHFCGHRPDASQADPNPSSGGIVGGDMRITEWQALSVRERAGL